MATTSGTADGAARATTPTLAGSVPQFIVGNEYSRRADIHLKYGGSWQNGISSSAVCSAIFLFTGETGEPFGYQDGFDSSGVFSYSGEGQVGDMQFKGGNRSLRDHASDGRSLYLFKFLGAASRYRYIGEFVLANHSVRQGPDRNGALRKIIVFHLLPVEPEQDAPATNNGNQAPQLTLSEARKLALQACASGEGPAGVAAVQTIYARSRAVRHYVLLRAKGTCEACHTPAPFLGSDGLPYLEAHHTTRLSDGGIDHPRHVAALCPSCHRRVHYGQDGQARNQALIASLKQLEPAD